MKTFFSTLVVLFLLVVIGGIYFVYSGSYDVAADRKDAPFLRWVLQTARERSIDRRADRVVPVSDSVLNDPATIRTGFEHYDEMCVVCHGAPGVEPGEARDGLNPRPPLLAEEAAGLSPRELFWIIKHGIRMTGMPAWGPTHEDDKIWAMVAFVKKLPALSAGEYRAMHQQESGSGGESHEHEHAAPAGDMHE
jgi:mono/diheme cytochrome c family protein